MEPCRKSIRGRGPEAGSGSAWRGSRKGWRGQNAELWEWERTPVSQCTEGWSPMS